MLNRRKFVRTLGASTVLPALSHALGGFASARFRIRRWTKSAG